MTLSRVTEATLQVRESANPNSLSYPHPRVSSNDLLAVKDLMKDAVSMVAPTPNPLPRSQERGNKREPETTRLRKTLLVPPLLRSGGGGLGVGTKTRLQAPRSQGPHRATVRPGILNVQKERLVVR
jgi:hypothetical protein